MSETERSSKEKRIDEARELVARLVQVKHKLAENECEFVISMDDRLRQYGYGARVSDKQMHWLKILDKLHVPDERQMSLLEGETNAT